MATKKRQQKHRMDEQEIKARRQGVKYRAMLRERIEQQVELDSYGVRRAPWN